MKVVHASQARRHWAILLGRVEHRGQRFLICRNGREVAAIIPATEVDLLERLVDEADIEEAAKALRDPRGRARLPWAELRRFAEISS
jgi:prevent-host-death family protein